MARFRSRLPAVRDAPDGSGDARSRQNAFEIRDGHSLTVQLHLHVSGCAGRIVSSGEVRRSFSDVYVALFQAAGFFLQMVNVS